MKKYIKPSMDLVKLENVSLLAASGSGNEVNPKLNEETPEGPFHARSFSLWDGAEE